MAGSKSDSKSENKNDNKSDHKSYVDISYVDNSYNQFNRQLNKEFSTDLERILEYLPLNISNLIQEEQAWKNGEIIEIRLRVNQPLQLISYKKEILPSDRNRAPYIIRKKDLERAFMILSKNSIYALERQLSEGYITIAGGHRVGFTGQAVMENGKLKTIRNINSLNYRITREVKGVGKKVINTLYNRQYDFYYNTMIISPPLCGKTTLLRDIIRIISDGDKNQRINGKKVAVVDERSEIAGAYNGVAQNKIGSRTDLLDNCPKAEGIMLLIRAMSPEVIAVDEIGREEDVLAIQEAVNSGVSIITTVHGRDLKTIIQRPSIRDLVEMNAFERYIILSN
ncbi:MAG: stage III sporulation protein AA, partial [Halanaerobiales bacterium]